jgi:hypothetical protein
MAKGRARTTAIAADLRRNPQAAHVKAWHAYRERRFAPKAVLPSSRGLHFTEERYDALIKNYRERADADSMNKTERAITRHETIRFLLNDPAQKLSLQQRLKLTKAALDCIPAIGSPVSIGEGYLIAKEFISDFKRTKGKRVFAFGAGYGPLLFLLKNFMGAKVRGVDLQNAQKDFIKSKKLGMIHEKSVSDLSLRKLGKFDATYSIAVFERDILDRETALGMLDNMAAMTRKGGKSYHVVLFESKVPVSKEEVVSRGFRIDKWQALGEHEGSSLFIKLTKIAD